MSTISRSNERRRYVKYTSIHLLGLLIVINYATAIDYAAYRRDAVPRGTSRRTGLTIGILLENSKPRNSSSVSTLQDATEHILQYGALLRSQILDTFGELIYQHYDEFSVSQIEALYRIYRETLERKYSIFDIVPSALYDPDTRPTKICTHINKHVHAGLSESSRLCKNLKIHRDPHGVTLVNPVGLRKICRLSEITRNYPYGFSLDAVLYHLRAGHLSFTPSLFSGLLHNIQYNKFDDKVRNAERELAIYLRTITGLSIAERFKKHFVSSETVGGLLRNYLTKGKTLFYGNVAKQAAYLSKHVVREVGAVSENIELLGMVYENSSINLRYLFELILSNDTVDLDIREARDYLLHELETKRIVEKYLDIEKYQYTKPDQLLLEILGQLKQINFAKDIAISLYVHARYWHKSHMIENLNELLELFEAYKNLRGIKTYDKLVATIDFIENNLRDSKNITIQLLCSRPRSCLRIGLEIVGNCASINVETKRAIEFFLSRTKCDSCLTDDSSEETLTEKILDHHEEGNEHIDENGTAEEIENSHDIEVTTPKSHDDLIDIPEITEIPITVLPDESHDAKNESSSAEATEEEFTEKECNGTNCNFVDDQCTGNNCTAIECEDDDCKVPETAKNCIGSQCLEKPEATGESSESSDGNCTGPDCSVNSLESLKDCEGSECLANSTEIHCNGPDCAKNSCEDGNCDEQHSENEKCTGPDCYDKSCKGEDCEESSTEVNVSCDGPDCSVPKIDCNGTHCPKINCIGDNCSTNVTSECKGTDCSKSSEVERICEGAECSPDEKDIAKDCDGNDCSNDEVVKDCEGPDCPIVEPKIEEDCKGSNCSSGSSDENSCKGSDCSSESNDEPKKEDCQGSECQSDEKDPAKDCKGDDCPKKDGDKDCPGGNCVTELPEIITSPKSKESFNPNGTILCDNSDPHYQRKLRRLRKMRLIDALSSKTKSSYEIFNKLIVSSGEKKTKIRKATDFKIKIGGVTSLKKNIHVLNPLIHVLGHVGNALGSAVSSHHQIKHGLKHHDVTGSHGIEKSSKKSSKVGKLLKKKHNTWNGLTIKKTGDKSNAIGLHLKHKDEALRGWKKVRGQHSQSFAANANIYIGNGRHERGHRLSVKHKVFHGDNVGDSAYKIYYSPNSSHRSVKNQELKVSRTH